MIEFANSGVPLSQTLDKRNIRHTPLGFSGRSIRDKSPKRHDDVTSRGNSKKERYLRILHEFHFEEKRILLPKQKIEHQEEFVRQMVTFDGADGKADDLVDMATYLIHFTGNNVIRIRNTSRNTNNNNTNNSLYDFDMCYNISNATYFNV